MPKLLLQRTLLGELKRSPRLLAAIYGPTSKGKGRVGQGRGEEGKVIKRGRERKGRKGRDERERERAWSDLQFSLCDATAVSSCHLQKVYYYENHFEDQINSRYCWFYVVKFQNLTKHWSTIVMMQSTTCSMLSSVWAFFGSTTGNARFALCWWFSFIEPSTEVFDRWWF